MSGAWTLPGPARFARTARDRLRRGDSVLVGIPARTGAHDFAAGLRRAIDLRFDLIEAAAPEERPVSSVVAEQLGIDLEPGPDAAVRLARDGALEDRYLAIAFAATAKPDDIKPWTDFLRALLAAARAITVRERPRLLIVGGHGCATALAGADPLAELWWWGVLNRLDTALHVQQRLDQWDSGELLRDVITEVAGYDLDLADYLVREWDGDESGLAAVLGAYIGPDWPRVPVPVPLPYSSTSWGAPPSSVVPLWDAGLADAWDSFRVCLHPASISPAALRQRVWRAQIRCLMPLIDEERARIEQWLRTEVKVRQLPRDKVLEPGDLFGLLQDNDWISTWRKGTRKRLIIWLRDARNKLAHLTPLSPQEIELGQSLIEQDQKLS